MRLKELESELQPLLGFDAPKREFEQYVTSAHLAARMIYTAESSFGDIDEKDVLDLGCGCAVLSCASVMMGANSVLSVDIDPDALAVARQNIASLEMEDEIELVHARIEPSPTSTTPTGKPPPSYPDTDGIPVFDPRLDFPDRTFQTVVMNPPFGSWRSGIDMVFLELACQVAEEAVYSLNKTSTRDFILKKAKSFGFEGEVLAEMRYDLPKTMAFHKKATLDIQVDFWRFSRIRKP